MKGKLLLGLTIATLISANSFAYEIHKGKITKHVEWSTGKNKAVFKDANVTMPNHNPSALSKSKNGMSYLRSYASANKMTGSVGELVTIPTEHSAAVQNQMDSPQVYYYRFGLCLLTTPHTEECSYSYDEITLEPGGTAYPSRNGTIGTVYFEPGEYTTSASTFLGVRSADSDGQTSNESISISTAKVVITDSKR